MTLIRWKPIREVTAWNPVSDVAEEIVNMQKEIDRMFSRFNGGVTTDKSLEGWSPAVDIVEDDHQFVVRADLPGLTKEDVKITVENSQLTIRGEKREEEVKEGKNYHRMERSYGSFYRSFTLPTSALNSKIEAEYKDGVLTLTIPKAEEAKPRSIEVKVK